MAIMDTVAAFLNKSQASIGSQENTSLNVLLDASVSETHTSSANITSHPVEQGANITDHVHREPDSITIQGVISNTPTRFPEGVVGVALIRSVVNLVSGVSNDLAKTAYDQLRQLVEGKELIKIATTLREYNDMLLENLTVTRDSDNGDCLNFTVTARQVRLIKTSSVSASPIPAPADTKKAAKKSLGKQSKQTVPAPARPTSVLQSANAGLSSLLGL